MGVGFKWPDSTITVGATADDVERAIRDVQWVTYDSQQAFREDMANRAKVWSGVEMEIDGSSLDFLWELERAQFGTVIPWIHSGERKATPYNHDEHRKPGSEPSAQEVKPEYQTDEDKNETLFDNIDADLDNEMDQYAAGAWSA